MIVIFQRYHFFEKLLGLQPSGGYKNIYGRIAFPLLLITSIFLPFTFFISNIHEDMDLAMSTLPLFFGHVPVVPIYFHLLVYRKRIYSLLDELQAIVNESMWSRIMIDSNGIF